MIENSPSSGKPNFCKFFFQFLTGESGNYKRTYHTFFIVFYFLIVKRKTKKFEGTLTRAHYARKTMQGYHAGLYPSSFML